ncbi:MAG: Smr protein/MutS2 [Xanthobacteraceae bacterium]|nr:Smr protein/MutS2 [Xanthobacteraceae bacterium]
MTADDDRPRRGRRPLRDEEHALWKEVTRSLKPLSRKQRVAATATAEIATPEVETKKPPPPPAKRPKPVRPVAPAPVVVKPAPVKAPPPLAPLGRRERSRVARGRVEIDARIDLHGMTQDEAHAALSRFLRRAQGNGGKLVLVITGKGARFGSDDDGRERGVLKRQVPMWLRLPGLCEIVIGFEDASIGHGGTGALYVRLRSLGR